MRVEEFDFNIEILQAVLWQYDNSPNLKDLMLQKEAWFQLEYNGFWNSWYNDVFNLQTANAFGLAVWSYILAVPLFVPISPEPSTKPVFGFNELLSTGPNVLLNTYLNFENSNFSIRETRISLTIEEQRLLLKLRYYQIISRGTIPEINAFLAKLFTVTPGIPYSGHAWVEDNLDMTMTYVFGFNIPGKMIDIFKNLDLLPRPAGVGIIYAISP